MRRRRPRRVTTDRLTPPPDAVRVDLLAESLTRHPAHQADASRPLGPNEGACTCGYVGEVSAVAAHVTRCATAWAARRARHAPPEVALEPRTWDDLDPRDAAILDAYETGE